MFSSYANNFCNIQYQCHRALKELELISNTVDEVVYPFDRDYAWINYLEFVSKYVNASKIVLFLGMNAVMAINGIPFGDYDTIMKSFDISITQTSVDPQREQSGKRLWRLLLPMSGGPQNFFAKCFIHNYCPLAFSQITPYGYRNVSLENIGVEQKKQIENVCDESLKQTIQYLGCSIVVAIGRYAEQRARNVVARMQGEPHLL